MSSLNLSSFSHSKKSLSQPSILILECAFNLWEPVLHVVVLLNITASAWYCEIGGYRTVHASWSHLPQKTWGPQITFQSSGKTAIFFKVSIPENTWFWHHNRQWFLLICLSRRRHLAAHKIRTYIDFGKPASENIHCRTPQTSSSPVSVVSILHSSHRTMVAFCNSVTWMEMSYQSSYQTKPGGSHAACTQIHCIHTPLGNLLDLLSSEHKDPGFRLYITGREPAQCLRNASC